MVQLIFDRLFLPFKDRVISYFIVSLSSTVYVGLVFFCTLYLIAYLKTRNKFKSFPCLENQLQIH